MFSFQERASFVANRNRVLLVGLFLHFRRLVIEKLFSSFQVQSFNQTLSVLKLEILLLGDVVMLPKNFDAV